MQGQLGVLFGASSHDIGRWLIEAGYRTPDKRPSDTAFMCGMCKNVAAGEGFHWAWHAHRTVAALQEEGHALIPHPPIHLVAPAAMQGPFSVKKIHDSEFAVANADESVAVWANTEANATAVARILSVAEKTGVIDRLLHRSTPEPSHS